jgi:Flp pilus assembly pilin Flp
MRKLLGRIKGDGGEATRAETAIVLVIVAAAGVAFLVLISTYITTVTTYVAGMLRT